MESINLRKLKLSDISFFAKWWRDDYLRTVTSGDSKPISNDEVKEYFDAMLKSEDDYHFMVELDNTVIGHISLNKRGDGWYETQIVIGNEQYRDHGYGTAAIQQLIKFAKEHQLNKVYLEVRPDNKPAIATYKKCGFRPIETIERPEEPYLKTVLRMELGDRKS